VHCGRANRLAAAAAAAAELTHSGIPGATMHQILLNERFLAARVFFSHKVFTTAMHLHDKG
jgi:hypothetical protein